MMEDLLNFRTFKETLGTNGFRDIKVSENSIFCKATNKSHDVTCNLAEFSGYNELRLSDKNTLTGTYYTKRIPSTRGNLLLIRRSSNDVINETTG